MDAEEGLRDMDTFEIPIEALNRLKAGNTLLNDARLSRVLPRYTRESKYNALGDGHTPNI